LISVTEKCGCTSEWRARSAGILAEEARLREREGGGRRVEGEKCGAK